MQYDCLYSLAICLTVYERLLFRNHEVRRSFLGRKFDVKEQRLTSWTRLECAGVPALERAKDMPPSGGSGTVRLPAHGFGAPGDHVDIGAHGQRCRAKIGDGKPARLERIVSALGRA